MNEQDHYDTIFTYYSGKIYEDFSLDTITNFDCYSCETTTTEKIGFTQGYWDSFKEDSTLIDIYYSGLVTYSNGRVIRGHMAFVLLLV